MAVQHIAVRRTAQIQPCVLLTAYILDKTKQSLIPNAVTLTSATLKRHQVHRYMRTQFTIVEFYLCSVEIEYQFIMLIWVRF